MDLSGKVALVTGGAVRVGKSIALALAEQGADICLSYLNSCAEAQATVAEIAAMGRRAVACRVDLKVAEDAAMMVEQAVSALGRLDVLVNSAAMWRRTPWEELSASNWDDVLDTNLRGPVLCARHAAPYLAAHGEGLIVNIVDLSAFAPFPGFLAHSAAKAGLLNATYALAMQLAPAVRVNAIAPGLVLPPAYFGEEQTRAWANKTALRRWGTPGDVAQAVVYLAQAGYVTGTVIHVDGGERLVEGHAGA